MPQDLHQLMLHASQVLFLETSSLSQAKGLEAQAKSLLAEATRLKAEAKSFAPAKAKATKTKAKAKNGRTTKKATA